MCVCVCVCVCTVHVLCVRVRVCVGARACVLCVRVFALVDLLSLVLVAFQILHEFDLVQIAVIPCLRDQA